MRTGTISLHRLFRNSNTDGKSAESLDNVSVDSAILKNVSEIELSHACAFKTLTAQVCFAVYALLLTNLSHYYKAFKSGSTYGSVISVKK